MREILTFRLVLVALLLSFAVNAHASSVDTDIDERYDENTEITVRGTVTEQMTGGGRGMGRGRGPVILTMKTRNKSYQVVTAPTWYLERQGLSFARGSVLEVRGSRFYGRDGIVYLIAREIRDVASSRVAVLRDASCRPAWHGHRMMQR